MSTLASVKGKVTIKPYVSGLPNAGLEKYDMVVADGAQHKELLGLVERNGVKCYLTGLNEMAPEVMNIRDDEKKAAVIRDIRKTIVFLENAIGGNYEITEKDIDEYAEVEEMMEVDEMQEVDEMKEVDEIVDGKKTGEKILKPTGKKILEPTGNKVFKPTGKKVTKATGKFNPTFWSKVKTFISQAPDKFNEKKERVATFWDAVEIKCGNGPIHLNPQNPHDLILIYAIKAGGFTIVAPSLEAARTAIEVPKFYLDNEEETAGIKTELKKLRNRVGSELQKLFDKDATKLFYVSKLCAVNSLSYRKSTALDILYDDCDKYINGETVDKNKKQTAEKFLEYCKTELADLRVQAIVRDATEMHLLTFKQDGQLYYNKTGTPMGKGVFEVVTFLKNPLNADVLKHISDEVEEEWKK